MTQTVVVRTPETTAVATHEVVRTTVVTRGIPGPRGPDGTPGPTGAGLSLLGVLGHASELPLSASAGDAYLITGELWVFDGAAWVNGGPIQGPVGPAGAAGKDGQIRFTGNGPPPPVIFGASPLDTYMDLDTGSIYKLN